jgi:hypothetical protein
MTRDSNRHVQVSLEYLKSWHEFFKEFMTVALASVTVFTVYINNKSSWLAEFPFLAIAAGSAFVSYSMSLVAAICGMYVASRRIWNTRGDDVPDTQTAPLIVRWFWVVIMLYAIGLLLSGVVVLFILLP